MKKSQAKILLGAPTPLSPMLRMAIRSISGIVVCIFASAAIAQNTAQNVAPKSAPQLPNKVSAEPIKVTLERKKVVLKVGVDTFENADAVKPGDVIEESATYKNVSDRVISKFVAQLPVPSNTELIANSTKPTAALASLDGAQYAPIPLKRAAPALAKNTQDVQMLPVPLSEYRYLRWAQDEISAGKTITVSARFRVLGNNLPGSVANTQLDIQPAKNDVARNTLGTAGTASVGINK